MSVVCIFFFKQKTAYEMRISDWSSDVCSSDLRALPFIVQLPGSAGVANAMLTDYLDLLDIDHGDAVLEGLPSIVALNAMASRPPPGAGGPGGQVQPGTGDGNDPTQQGDQGGQNAPEIGRAHVCNPVTNAHLVCR